MDVSGKASKDNPLSNANPISRLFIWWMTGLYWKSYKRPLTEADLYKTLRKDKSDHLADKLELKWNSEMQQAKEKGREPSFLKALIKTYWVRFAVICAVNAFDHLCLRICQPILLGLLISYFAVDSHVTRDDALLYAGGLTILVLTKTFVSHHIIMQFAMLGMRVRIACCSLLYRKLLRIRKGCMDQTTTGQIVNLMSNDVNRFDMGMQYYCWIVQSFCQVALITYFLFNYVGWSCLAGFVYTFLSNVPIQAYLGRVTSNIRKRIATRTDERMKMMNEIVSGIQVIKMYAWEKPFAKMVSTIRKLEVDQITKASYVRGFLYSAIVFIERTSLFVTLCVYAFLGNDPLPSKVFAMAQFYNLINVALGMYFPLSVTYVAESRISIKRFQEFLLREEESSKSGGTRVVAGGPDVSLDGGAVTLTNVSARWGKGATVLSDLCLHIPPGALCAIIGPVGSGKSSLLQSLLGEVTLTSGNMHIGGSLSYASQEPWIFVGSVRQNILFGQPYDAQRYKTVVSMCALKRDFKLLPFGDHTLVGEKGITLSGGQRARVNLARAVYRDADIYLMDDPLSAVDTHVGKHLFSQCIGTYLGTKTRILVTHQLQYLQDADIIIVLNNGRIEVQGSYKNIINSEQKYAQLLAATNEDEDAEEGTENKFRRASERQSESQFEDLLEDHDVQNGTGEQMTQGKFKWSTYWKYIRASGGPCLIFLVFLVIIVGQVATNACDYWVTYWTGTLQYYVSHPEMREQGPSRDFFVGIYGGIALFCMLLVLLRSTVCFKMCMRASITLHDRMFGNILRATMHFFDTNPSGRIMNRFSKDIGAIDELLPPAMIMAMQIFLVFFGILVMILLANYFLSIPLVLIGCVFLWTAMILINASRNVKRLEGAKRSPVFSHLSDTLNGLTTIRASDTQEILKKEFDINQDEHTSAWFLFVSTSGTLGLWLDLLSVVFVAIVTFSFLLITDHVFPGATVGLAISQALILNGMLQFGVIQLSEVISQMTSVERVLDYTKIPTEPNLDSEPDKKPMEEWPQQGKLIFESVYLQYGDSDPPVLKDLSFSVQQRHKVGIVGRTGAGKSSLISALFRLAKVSGSIRIDGVDTGSIGLHDLRKKISIIPQEPVLFSAPLRDNLDPFHEFEDHFLWTALEEVELKKHVESLDFMVSEGGSNFSVGQRQLVCLARAILRKNKILVLDEATANVDPETDRLIQETIRKKFNECTVLTIAHRLHTIMDSDRVLVMDAGTMVEYDHPHLLLRNTNGIFYSMVQQTGKSMAENLAGIAEQAYSMHIYNETADRRI